FWPPGQLRSAKPSAARPARTPSMVRPEGPIQALSTAYLKANATPRASVTAPIRFTHASPSVVSSWGDSGLAGAGGGISARGGGGGGSGGGASCASCGASG